MRLSMRPGYGEGFVTTGHARRAGLDVVWVVEAYGQDAATALGTLSARTPRLQLASGSLPIYSRPPVLLAQTAAGLDELSDG